MDSFSWLPSVCVAKEKQENLRNVFVGNWKAKIKNPKTKKKPFVLSNLCSRNTELFNWELKQILV